MRPDGIEEWQELGAGKEDFQKIVRLLVEYDERVGRYRRFTEPEHHYMRKTISVGDVKELRIFVRTFEALVYHIVVEMRSEYGFVATSWIHEDGIAMERREAADNSEDPVHSIVCLTDLIQEYGIPIGSRGNSAPAGPTLKMMKEA